jgi:outer membrane protein TolC
VETAYFDLIYAQENVKVQQVALNLADQLLSENKKRVEVGALAPLDEKQAASQVAATRATLIAAQASQETAQRVLKDLLSDDYTKEWAKVSIAPTDKLLAIPETFDLQESWRKGLAQGPRYQLLQRRLTVEENAQAVRLQRNQVFPQVDLIGDYGYSGTGKEFSGALDQIRRQDNPFWAFGAQLTVPLAQISARNNLKVAKAVKEQNTLVLKQSEQKTLIQIENDIANAQSDFQSVDATREARFYAEAALDAEQKKLESGKSTSFVVLDLQQKLTDARSKEIRALADYNIALAQLAFDEGSTLERRRVDLSWK